MSIDLNKFDFGFTAVDENELEAVQKTSSKLESTSTKASELEDKPVSYTHLRAHET